LGWYDFRIGFIKSGAYGAVHVKGDINVKNEYSFLGGTWHLSDI